MCGFGRKGTDLAAIMATCLRWTMRSITKAMAVGMKEHHAHHRTHDKVLLADHLLVNVRGEDVVVPAHHLGRAEIRESENEADKDGAHQAVLDAGEGDREESSDL